MYAHQDVSYKEFQQSNASKADEALLVRFFLKEREDRAASEAEGRPIYKEVEYVDIRVPGARDALACRPATHQDKQRFPRHYEAFKKRTEMPETGTPLSQWPQVSRSQVEEMAFANIKTVEQLADVSDTHIGKMHGGYKLKARAQEWLKSAGETALIAEKEAMSKRITDLEAKLEEVLSREHVSDPLSESLPEEPAIKSKPRPPRNVKKG